MPEQVPVVPVPEGFEQAVQTPEMTQGVDPKVVKQNLPAPVIEEQGDMTDDLIQKADQTIADAGIKFDTQEVQAKAKKLFTSTDPNDSWKFVPETKKEKFLPLAEAVYLRSKAQQSGDKDDFIKYDTMVKAHSYAEGLEKPQNPEIMHFAQVDPKTGALRYFNGVREVDMEGNLQIRNIRTNKYESGDNIPISDEDYKQIGPVMSRFDERTAKFNMRRAKFTSSLESGTKMIQLAKEYDLASTKVGGWTASARSFLEELKAGVTVLGGEEQAFVEELSTGKTQAQLDEAVKTAEKTGDSTQVKGMVKNLQAKIDSMMSDGIKSQAEAAVIFETYKTALTYDLAAANGETGNGLTQKDVQMFREMIYGNDPATIRRSVSSALSTVYRNLNSEATGINSDSGSMELKNLEQRLGFKLGVSVDRWGNYLQRNYEDNPQMFTEVNSLFKDVQGYSIPKNQQKLAPEVTQETAPMEIEVNGRKVNTGKVYTTPSGRKVRFNADGTAVEVK
jgi:hypothetical protein